MDCPNWCQTQKTLATPISTIKPKNPNFNKPEACYSEYAESDPSMKGGYVVIVHLIFYFGQSELAGSTLISSDTQCPTINSYHQEDAVLGTACA